MIGEAAKYEAVWSHDAYRQVAPGEHHVEKFLEIARPGRDRVLCDFGCGTGRGALAIAAHTDLSVVGIDFAANCLDREVREQLGERFRFLQHDLTTPLNETFDYGFCTDVLEHIPTEDVDKVLLNICTAAKNVYFAISTQPDVMGALVGEPLHLTVKDPFWWHDKLLEIGFRVDWSYYNDGLVCFYGSAYMAPIDYCEMSRLNEEEEKVKENIRKNLRLDLQEVCPHEKQPETVVYLLAGGPSLKDYEEKIVEAGKAGTPIVTVNGTYKWLHDRGVRPAAMVMMDARSWNRKFVEPLVDTCKYLMSSQCDHELVASLPKERTWLWHADTEIVKETVDEWTKEYAANREWWPVYGGTTVVSRALVLLAQLGFRKIEVFGWDSCLRGDDHHAYDQPENDSKKVLKINYEGKSFSCHPWMLVQANEFHKIAKFLAQIPDFDMILHGDGLLSWMLEHSANKAALEGA